MGVVRRLSLAVIWAVVPAVAGAGQVACPDVVSRVHRAVRENRGGEPDLTRIARDLGCSEAWVAYCLQVYGRRGERRGATTRNWRWEELEPGEEPDASAGGEVAEPDEEPRRRSRERPPRIRPTPAPPLDF